MMNKRQLLACIVGSACIVMIGLVALGATPVAVDDAATTAEDAAVTVAVLANDTGLSDIPISVTIVTQPTAGSASVNAGDTITYTPVANFYGTDSFTYKVEDVDHETATATVTITVSSVNDTPLLEENVYATPEDTPLAFRLKATDPELDPFYPDEDLLKFAIVTGPRHGTLTGDLSALTYETPHSALVALTYTPEAGFAGNDSITFSVTDPLGAVDTAVIQFKVGVPADVGFLSGRWLGSFTIDGQSFSFTAFSTTLSVLYQISSLRAEATARWSEDEFSSLRLSASLPLGELSIISNLSFDPTGPQYFQYWQTTTRTGFFDFYLTHTFYLAPSQTNSYNQLVASWKIEDASVTSTTKLTGLNFCFASEDVTARWTWLDCDINLQASLSITQQGFDHVSFTARNIPILPTEMVGFGIFLRAEVTFSLTSKVMETTLYCQSDWLDCFRILCELTGDDLSIDGISIYGLQFQTTFPDGISVRTDTSFAEDKNASLTGYSDYFERFRLWGPSESCCGSPGQWEMRTYFQSSHVTLFDWGMTAMSLTEVISDAFRFSIGVNFRATDPIWQLTFGWEVDW